MHARKTQAYASGRRDTRHSRPEGMERRAYPACLFPTSVRAQERERAESALPLENMGAWPNVPNMPPPRFARDCTAQTAVSPAAAPTRWRPDGQGRHRRRPKGRWRRRWRHEGGDGDGDGGEGGGGQQKPGRMPLSSIARRKRDGNHGRGGATREPASCHIPHLSGHLSSITVGIEQWLQPPNAMPTQWRANKRHGKGAREFCSRHLAADEGRPQVATGCQRG